MQPHTPARLPSSLLLAMMLGAAVSPSVMAQIAPGSRPSPIPAPVTTIPVTPPTSALRSSTADSPQSASSRLSRHPEVTFTHGQLAIAADNSSLNQILREISRATGIKITGGVADERVYGKYGPSATSDVLNSLLDGTGSNVLLLQADSNSPGELILTPRHGDVTPPNPNATGFDDGDAVDDSPQGSPAPQAQQQQQPPPPPQPAPANPATAAAAAGATPASTDATDPNAVKSPQQIYEQLQHLRQQQQSLTPQ